MLSRRVMLFGLALALLWLGPALIGVAGEAYAAEWAAASSSGYVQGTLPGNTGGSYAVYTLTYPGDDSPAEISFEISTADTNVVQATGINVYGPTAGKVYASISGNGASRRTTSFSSAEPGKYFVQVFSYAPVPVTFSLVASYPLGSRTIVLDPGHGGPEIGAAAPGLLEKDVNLRIALKLAALLRGDGYQVVLTRDADRTVSPSYRDVQGDLQARIDIANAAHADLFVSIHNNGGPRSESGTEVWYNRERPFSDRSFTLARLVQSHLLEQIRALGYPVRDRGVKDDSRFRVFAGRAYNIYVLGPGTSPRPHVPTQMPAVLGESLFLTNPGDVAMLRQERTLDAIARGYRDAIGAYFQAYPD